MSFAGKLKIRHNAMIDLGLCIINYEPGDALAERVLNAGELLFCLVNLLFFRKNS